MSLRNQASKLLLWYKNTQGSNASVQHFHNSNTDLQTDKDQQKLEMPIPQTKMLSNKTFGLIFSAIFFVVGIYPFIIYDFSPRYWALIISLAFICVAFLKPTWLLPLNKAWMKFGLLMHSIINPILMGIIFFTSVMPTGLLRRLFGRDSLRLKFDSNADSYWIEREGSLDSEFFDTQF